MITSLLRALRSLFSDEKSDYEMKLLIVGLGNIGQQYHGTRHNIGFTILDAFAQASNVVFTTERYGDVARMRLKNKQLVLLKISKIAMKQSKHSVLVRQ